MYIFAACGSVSSLSTLLLTDTNTTGIQILINSLQSTGFTVSYTSGNIGTYSGNPPASNFGSVILLNVYSYTTDMPTSGQLSILNAQQNLYYWCNNDRMGTIYDQLRKMVKPLFNIVGTIFIHTLLIK